MKDSVLLRKSKNGRACKNLAPTAAQSFFCKQKFTESHMSREDACRLYLDGYLLAGKEKQFIS